MREIKRIDKILSEIRKLWYTYPDQRFFQLLSNIGLDHKTDLFYLEDTDLLSKLEQQAKLWMEK